MKYVASYLALYAATLMLLVRYEHFQILEPLLILLVVGGAFTLMAWLLTRRAEPLLVVEPRAERRPEQRWNCQQQEPSANGGQLATKADHRGE
ncbi:MAG: hypothetical protein ACXW2Q_13895 [Thermoanaerobaculia bacterium]